MAEYAFKGEKSFLELRESGAHLNLLNSLNLDHGTTIYADWYADETTPLIIVNAPCQIRGFIELDVTQAPGDVEGKTIKLLQCTSNANEGTFKKLTVNGWGNAFADTPTVGFCCVPLQKC